MSLRKIVLLAAAVVAASFSSATAHAQFGAYGMFTVNQLSNIKSSPVAEGNTGPYAVDDSVNPLGGTGGIFYDWKKFGPVRLGFDARGSILTTKRGAYTNFNGPGARIYSGLGGVRGSFHTRWQPLKPYVQGSFGWARSDYGLYTSSNQTGITPNTMYNNFEWQALAGLDIKLLPYMDFRLAEFGYGGLDNSHNYPIKQVSSGVVFHLPY
jgi:hypothetical protein